MCYFHTITCKVNKKCVVALFREFSTGRPLSLILALMNKSATVQIYPFLLHTVVMGLFASILGPFGGFFASGFKRAFKIKVGYPFRTRCYILSNWWYVTSAEKFVAYDDFYALFPENLSGPVLSVCLPTCLLASVVKMI